MATAATVVLAAGGGSRFRTGARFSNVALGGGAQGGPAAGGTSEDPAAGAHKLLALLDGRPLVCFAVEAAAAAGADETVVVTGAVELAGHLPPEVTILENASWAEGQATSLAVALDWCRRRGHVAAVVGLGDVPGIPAAAWRALLDVRAPLAVATFGGLRHPPVRLERSVWAAVPVVGDEGARSLLRAPGVMEVPCPGVALDVDTVEDLVQVALLLGREGGTDPAHRVARPEPGSGARSGG